MAKDKITKKLEELEQANEGQDQVVDTFPARADSDTRQKLAKRFVNFYFWILILIIVGVPTYNYLMFAVANKPNLIISIKDAILTYSAVAGPTFGLVVAYYFKSKSDN